MDKNEPAEQPMGASMGLPNRYTFKPNEGIYQELVIWPAHTMEVAWYNERICDLLKQRQGGFSFPSFAAANALDLFLQLSPHERVTKASATIKSLRADSPIHPYNSIFYVNSEEGGAVYGSREVLIGLGNGEIRAYGDDQLVVRMHAPSAGVMFNQSPASIEGGILTRDINLLKVQAACNYAFQETGDHEFAEAADEIAKATGVVQGPHGEWTSPDAGERGFRASPQSSQPAETGFEIHGVHRWDVMQGTVDAAPGEPTYTVKVRAHCGQIAIEIKAPETIVAMSELHAGTADDSDPRLALPCLEVTLEVNEGLPCLHVHGGVSGELAQTVFALPDAKVAIRAVDDPGMKEAVIAVPDSYTPDFDEANARFAAVQGIDLAVPADLEAPQ